VIARLKLYRHDCAYNAIKFISESQHWKCNCDICVIVYLVYRQSRAMLLLYCWPMLDIFICILIICTFYPAGFRLVLFCVYQHFSLSLYSVSQHFAISVVPGFILEIQQLLSPLLSVVIRARAFLTLGEREREVFLLGPSRKQ
jgi:hypothetical protein